MVAGIVLPKIFSLGPKYGFDPTRGFREGWQPLEKPKRKKVIVEFSSPDTAMGCHAGHLRSTIPAGFIAKIFEGHDWDVLRMNYLSDWRFRFGLLAV